MRLKHDLAFYVVLENIRSLENVGAIFRTCDALGVTKIFLGGISGVTYAGMQKILHPKISKTALGAEKNVEWEYNRQTGKIIQRLKSQGIQVVAFETQKGAVEIAKFKPRFPLALVLGNEVSGISSATLRRCDKIVKIPMLGAKESLNVSVAFGIAGFQMNLYRFKY